MTVLAKRGLWSVSLRMLSQGTALYMAPEVLRREQMGRQADVWAVSKSFCTQDGSGSHEILQAKVWQSGLPSLCLSSRPSLPLSLALIPWDVYLPAFPAPIFRLSCISCCIMGRHSFRRMIRRRDHPEIDATRPTFLNPSFDSLIFRDASYIIGRFYVRNWFEEEITPPLI